MLCKKIRGQDGQFPKFGRLKGVYRYKWGYIGLSRVIRCGYLGVVWSGRLGVWGNAEFGVKRLIGYGFGVLVSGAQEFSIQV